MLSISHGNGRKTTVTRVTILSIMVNIVENVNKGLISIITDAENIIAHNNDHGFQDIFFILMKTNPSNLNNNPE